MASEHALAAKAIRKELKKNGIKAKVRSSSFVGGNAVDIDLIDVMPAVRKKVEEFAREFEYGSFNSMEDIYEHNNRRDDIPQVKYVMIDCDFSEELEKEAWEFLAPKMASCEGLPADYSEARNMFDANGDHVSLLIR